MIRIVSIGDLLESNENDTESLNQNKVCTKSNAACLNEFQTISCMHECIKQYYWPVFSANSDAILIFCAYFV